MHLIATTPGSVFDEITTAAKATSRVPTKFGGVDQTTNLQMQAP
jgi:hypothetical protein